MSDRRTITAPSGATVVVIDPPGSRKVECAACGHRGYKWGRWLNRHDDHTVCTCGAVVTVSGFGQHQGSKARHGKPCPGWSKSC